MRILPRTVLRTTVSALLFGMGSAFLLASLTAPAHGQRKPLDRIAAVVGDNVILTSEVDQLVRQQTRQQQRSYSDELWMQGLETLVDQKILAEKARRDTTITVSDQLVSQQLDRRIQQMAQRVGGEDELEKMYGQSILEIKETFQSDFRSQMLAQRLRQKRMRNIDVTPSEVRQWFEEIPTDSLPDLPKTVRLSHIVRYPKPSEEAKSEAQKLIRTVRDSIVDGNASFSAMAKQYSDDAQTASAGGALGTVNLDQLVPNIPPVLCESTSERPTHVPGSQNPD